MPTFYSFTENGVKYSFDDVFVPSEYFQQGNLWTWGYNAQAQLGDNTTTNRSTPVTTFSGGVNWKQVSCGDGHTAAIKTDGTLWVWGANSTGQLGINTTTFRSTPVTTFSGGTDWKQVSCGEDHTGAIKTDGSLWVWGGNTYGQLGDNTTLTKLTPVTTFTGGTNWKQVSCSYFFNAAIKTDGTLWVWGGNYYGQLGDNTTLTKLTPVTTFSGGTNWKQVSCGIEHISAIKTDGTLWVWGENAYSGTLGDNTNVNKLTPVTTFSGGTDWKQVGSGDYFMFAIKTNGTLWGWGNNVEAQLGDNTIVNKLTPVTTFSGGTNWKTISQLGSWCTTAIKTDGSLWVWGANDRGQLGVNSSVLNISTPVTTFAGGSNWKQVSSGGYYSSMAAIEYEETL